MQSAGENEVSERGSASSEPLVTTVFAETILGLATRFAVLTFDTLTI